MFDLIITTYFCKYVHILNLMPATCFKKVGTGACLTLCYITSSSDDTLRLQTKKLHVLLVGVLQVIYCDCERN